jgi:hypothetical protein
MPVRISERELVIPALKCAAATRDGIILTTDLIDELTDMFHPEGEDAEILDGRTDTRFSQKVRNLISHRAGQNSMFSKGYAEYTGDGIRITDAGLNFLDQVPE